MTVVRDAREVVELFPKLDHEEPNDEVYLDEY